MPTFRESSSCNGNGDGNGDGNRNGLTQRRRGRKGAEVCLQSNGHARNFRPERSRTPTATATALTQRGKGAKTQRDRLRMRAKRSGSNCANGKGVTTQRGRIGMGTRRLALGSFPQMLERTSAVPSASSVLVSDDTRYCRTDPLRLCAFAPLR
jgi:hypothetical protein